MSQLIIADLNFFESEFPSKSKVIGGGRRRPPVGAVASSVSSGVASQVNYQVIDGVPTVSASVSGAAAGAAAGSIDGQVVVSTGVVVSAR